MIKIVIIACLAVAVTSQKKTLKIKEHLHSLRIESGYELSDGDSTFIYKEHHYVVLNREIYNQGRIQKGFLRRALGYLELSQKDIVENNDPHYPDPIKAILVNPSRISINNVSHHVNSIDTGNRMVYYLTGEKNTIDCLIYQ